MFYQLCGTSIIFLRGSAVDHTRRAKAETTNVSETQEIFLLSPGGKKTSGDEEKREMGKSKQQISESRKRLFKVKSTSDEQVRRTPEMPPYGSVRVCKLNQRATGFDKSGRTNDPDVLLALT